MSQEEHKKQKNINIEIKEEVASGVYSNLVVVNHSPSEFVVDLLL